MEVWGEKIFPEGVGVKGKLGQGEGEGKEKYYFCPTPHPQFASAPILYRSTIQDGGIENPIYYLVFRSKITPALQAMLLMKYR